MTKLKLDESWDNIFRRYEARGRSSLTEAERDCQCVSWFRYEVGNGGLVQFFSNPWRDEWQLDDTMAALQRIGAPFAAASIKNVAVLFQIGVPFDTEHRNEEMLSWPDGGYQDDVLNAACDNICSRLALLDELFNDFLIQNDFCDPEDLV